MNVTTTTARQVLDPPAARRDDCSWPLAGVVVVGVEGDIDVATAPELRQTLQELLAPSAPVAAGKELLAVVVDLTEVEFIDSCAIGVLVQGHHLARRGGQGYALAATHPMIHTLFRVTALVRVLPLHADVAAAVASLHLDTRSTASASTISTATAVDGDDAPR